jgi:hypothetical protein
LNILVSFLPCLQDAQGRCLTLSAIIAK